MLALSFAIHAGVFATLAPWGSRSPERIIEPGPQHTGELLEVTAIRAGNATTQSTTRSQETREASAIAGGKSAATAPQSASTSSGTAPTALESYALLVRERIGNRLRYPWSLRRLGISGRVGLALTLDASGKLRSQAVAKSSGSPELDRLALEAASEAQPFPAPPPPLQTGDLVLSLPVEFRLK